MIWKRRPADCASAKVYLPSWRTPLWAASQNGSAAMVRKLLEAGANRTRRSGQRDTADGCPVRLAGIVEQLLARDANVARGATGQTALMWAVAQTPRCGEGVARARRRCAGPVGVGSDDGYAAWLSGYSREIPHGGDTALMLRRAWAISPRRSSWCCRGNVNDAGMGITATVLAALGARGARRISAREGRRRTRRSALPRSGVMRRDEKVAGALLAHGADPNAPLRTWTPTRRSSHDFHFEPELVGATPFWLAARFIQPVIMRLLVKHGADPLFVHHSDRVADRGFQHRTEVTTALMAATGMGGGTAWVQPARGEREALTLEAVKLAAELGAMSMPSTPTAARRLTA